MYSGFWSNTIWFVLLGVSTLIELALILIKAKRPKLMLAFFLTVSGITFFYEMSILSYFKAYAYYPMLIPDSPPDDYIAGNLFSQFSVSATAVLISVFNLKNYWFFIFAAAYGLIEELFLKMGVYEHYWYRTWMTVISLLLLFWITKKMYTSIKHTGFVWRYIYIFFGTLALFMHANIWTLKLSGIQMFSESFLPDKERSLVVLTGLYFLLLSNIMMAVYFSKIKWWWKSAVVLALYAAHYSAAKLQLIYYKEGWFFIIATISIFSMYIYIFIINKLYVQTE